MPNMAHDLATKFIGHLNYIDLTRVKMERYLQNNIIVLRDIEQIYSGLYLDAITSFERLIEDLFLGILVGNLNSRLPRVSPRINYSSHKMARIAVFGGKNYANWLPYSYTLNRARAFYRQRGLPFNALNNSDINIIDMVYYIRNAIAHKSHYSIKKFKEEVIGNINLNPREKKPAGFLRTMYRAFPPMTRYEYYIGEIKFMARKICF